MKTHIRVIETGVAICHFEPRGDIAGLGGFALNGEYPYEKCQRRGERRSTYYRVYLDSKYYETCGPMQFRQCFKAIPDKPKFMDDIDGRALAAGGF